MVDLHWAESASGKELSSLVKQLCYVYGRARASLMPPRLALTSYQGRAAVALKRYARGRRQGRRGSLPLALFLLAFDHAKLLLSRVCHATLRGNHYPGTAVT